MTETTYKERNTRSRTQDHAIRHTNHKPTPPNPPHRSFKPTPGVSKVVLDSDQDGGQIHLFIQPATIRSASIAAVRWELKWCLTQAVSALRVDPHVLQR
jgi:hypothetical protein